MEEIEIVDDDEELGLPQPPSLTVAVSISGNRKSKHIIKWALDKFVPEGKSLFKLIHVYTRITAVPTPMGNFIPISQVRDDLAAAYRKEMEWKKKKLLLPFKNMCAQRKVLGDIIMIESDDVANAVAGEIAKNTINNLVIGVSSLNLFRRKVKRQNLSARISECCPSFCTVYAVSKGNLSSVRPSKSETSCTFEDDTSYTNYTLNSLCYSSSSISARSSVASYSHFHPPSLPMQQFQALSTINQTLLSNTQQDSLSRSQSLHIGKDYKFSISCPGNSDIDHSISQVSNCTSTPMETQSWISGWASTSEVPTDFSSKSQVNIRLELERLKIQLRHARGMYAIAQSETINASRKLNNINKWQLDEETKLKELNIMEEKANELITQEREKYEVAKREAMYIRECAEIEASQKREAEKMALREAIEKEKLGNALLGDVQLYQNFTWEEIVSATSSFSEDLRIGTGAYGVVYKGSFRHTMAAVKVLHSKEAPQNKQFQQELEILSKIRHPHLVLLIGANPDRGCIVYEYMENGSLGDRLLRKNGTTPIPWFDRFRIAREVASVLVFLHNFKPEPIVHRDLKPENILLDRNFVSKIGDVGLSKMLQADNPSSPSFMSKETGIVGTLCYLDPEYQRTGLNSPKSDVYAFGMVILQLVTAKPAMALAHVAETAVNDNKLTEILDSEAGEWPFEETKELVKLGLKCSELRRKDRPDLKDQVLPVLEKLEKVANRARDLASSTWVPPMHFICPILQDVMNDPCVAADGYTYDRQAIEIWLEEKGNSPMTNMPFPNKKLIPNHTLSAIMEWKCRKQ